MPKYNKIPSSNHPAPPISPKWQEQLTKLLGLNPYGLPKLKLVWGMAATRFYFERERLKYIRANPRIHTGWQEKKDGEIIDRYPPSLTPPEVEAGNILERLERIDWIGVDRWFIELWQGPRIAGGGHTEKSWNENFRYQMHYDPTKGIYRQVDVHGEFPSRGKYAIPDSCYPWMISRHARAFNGRVDCCDERAAQGLRCFGQYRAPEQRDIDYIAYLIQEKEQYPYLSGYDEIAPESSILQPLKDAIYEEAKIEEKKDEEIDYRIKGIRHLAATQPVHFDIRRN